MTRCPDQVNVGAYVLDVLEPDERQRMQRHLGSCPACSADLDDLAVLPTRLEGVPAADVLGARRSAVPSEVASGRLHAGTAGRVRRWRRAGAPTLAAALVVVVGGAVVAVVAVQRADGPPQPEVVTAAAGAVRARADLTATQNGTRVVLVLGGVPADQQCRLVAVGRHGQRQTASTWTATYSGDASVLGWLSMRPGDIDRLVIETLDGVTLITLPSPRG